MGIFGRIIDSITINDKAVEKYNARIELELKSTVMISPTPSNITEIISRMRVHNVKHGRNQKYFDILFNFDKNNSQISSHNDMVTIIKENAAAFINTYNDILKNPNEYKESLIQKYEYAIRLTKDFVVLSDYVSRFVRNYEDIKYNMAEIKRQHALYINAWKCLDLRSLQFIDYKKESDLIENLNEVIKTIPSKKYYDIPNQNGLKQTIKNHNDQFLANQKQNVLYLAREFEIVYKNVLENPYIFDKNLLCKYDECTMLGRHYPSTETEIKSFVTKFDNLKNDFEQLKSQFDLYEKARKCLDLRSIGYVDEEKAMEIEVNLKNILKNVSNKRYYAFPNENGLSNAVRIHNETFIENSIKDSLFDDINGISLDEDQRRAIVTDEKVNLVVAGAGSGKTLTICGKLKYLTEKQGISPSEILLLSFSNASADDLDKKAKKINKEFEATTFHKKGLEILKTANDCTYVVETQFEKIIDDFFNEELINRHDLLEKVINYYGLYYYSNKNAKRYETEGELFEALKTKEFKTLKDKLVDVSSNAFEKRTLNRELVKSFEELSLANFYFLNGIEYVYEKTYEHDTSTSQKRQYQPDFYLPKHNIYHEHYGINEKGKATQFSGEEARLYEEGVQWKRNIHSQYQTKCIETYSYQFSNGSIFKTLEATLKQNGIELQPIPKEVLWNKIHGVINNADFESFKRLIMSFISLYKSRYTDESMFDKMKYDILSSDYESQRIAHLLDICKEVYRYYKKNLYYVTIENDVKKEKIDFDDMILKSTKQLQSLDSFKYKYIVVDEFQDISFSRIQFLKSLVKHGNAKLFLVGDDWQSIYRFSGSDVDLFINVEKYLGKTNKSVIRSTHRNSVELIKITEPFIMANSEQMKKYVSSDKHTDGPVRIMKYKENKIGAFDQILEIIYSKNPTASVLVLGRNKFDINSVLQSRSVYRKNDGTLVFDKYKTLDVKYTTVHSSKGLEADYVILINAEDNKVGFPNQIEDDDLLLLVLSNASEFPYAEERRLFYVALTRTKNICYILTCVDNPSVFVKEIEKDCKIFQLNDVPSENDKIACPYCSSGALVIRENSTTGSKFYGCSNFPYCNYKNDDLISVYKNQRCPDCGDYLRLRTNKTTGNKFYGCNSFPHCKYIKK